MSSLLQIDRLTRQSHNKSQTISKLQNQIACLKSDIQTQKQINSRTSQQNKVLKNQLLQLKLKLQEQQFQKQNDANRYLLVLQKLQEQVQSQKRKFNKLNNKIAPLVDYDSVRLQVMNELNQQHDIEVQKYKHTIEVQKDQIHKLKRQKTLVQHKLQTLKIQHEQKVRQLNYSVKNQSSQNQMSILSLEMSKQIQNRLKMSYQTVRKEAEYYKDKYFTTQKKYQQKITNMERQINDIKRRSFQNQ